MASSWASSWGTSWANSWGSVGAAAAVVATLPDVSGSGHRKKGRRRKTDLSADRPQHFQVSGEALRQLVYLHLADVLNQDAEEKPGITEEKRADSETKEPIAAAEREETIVRGPSPAVLAKRILDLEERFAKADLAEIEAVITARFKEMAQDEEDIAVLLLLI